MSETVTYTAMRALIEAINAGDRDAFFGVLAEDATMSDDGIDRNLADWADREIFTSNGRCTGGSSPVRGWAATLAPS